MGDVVVLPGTTTLDIPVERVLDAAKHLDSVLILGLDDTGEFYAASSSADVQWWVFMCAKFQHMALSGDFSGRVHNG